MGDRFESLARQLDELRRGNRSRVLVPREAPGMRLAGPDGRTLVNFGGNDYLGIAAEAMTLSGIRRGAAASALVCGWTDRHATLAQQLADFEQTESAVLFPSGFAACSGTVATLCRAGDLVLSDELNHASLIDGCRLSRAQRLIVPHRDVDFAEQVLRRRRAEFNSVWIVTDGVFSMDGHLAPLTDWCDLAARHDARLVVDEAHGTGVLGDAGRGVCEALEVKDRVDVRIGTLSKAMGSQGGFVAAPTVVCDYLINRCRPLIYSTAAAPVIIEGALGALATIRGEPGRRYKLHDLARRFRRHLGIEPADAHEANVPIVAVVVGDDSLALESSRQLARDGFFVPAIRPPTVPEGSARLRVSLSAAHEPGMVDGLAAAMAKAGLPTRR